MNGTNIKDIKTPSFVPSSSSGRALSVVEGLREHFSATCQDRYCNHAGCHRTGGKFAGFLNLFHWPLQSQPHCLQYHSVMPSHSSRSARIALPASMDFWSDGVMTPWMIGTTADEPHSGQAGGFLCRLGLVCFRAISLLVIAGRQCVSF
jgi:hypothetical protein